MSTPSCAIVNHGNGSWAFEPHANHLTRALWIEVSPVPRDYNYLLSWEHPVPPSSDKLFIPFNAIKIASDKRLQAELFLKHKVSTPETHLLDTPEDVKKSLSHSPIKEWALKYPVACGASGHRLLRKDDPIPNDWPKPYVLQEFVRMENPEVYRTYCVTGTLFGWNARRFPTGTKPSPWVAHARGARYVHFQNAPSAAQDQAQAALTATGLLSSFGCVDLIQKDGRWLVLEIGTDGVFNHVDRDVENPALVEEIDRRIAEAFWSKFDFRPWGQYGWKPKPENGSP